MERPASSLDPSRRIAGFETSQPREFPNHRLRLLLGGTPETNHPLRPGKIGQDSGPPPWFPIEETAKELAQEIRTGHGPVWCEADQLHLAQEIAASFGALDGNDHRLPRIQLISCLHDVHSLSLVVRDLHIRVPSGSG